MVDMHIAGTNADRVITLGVTKETTASWAGHTRDWHGSEKDTRAVRNPDGGRI